MNKRVYIVATGTDGSKTLTPEARRAIEASDTIIGAKRMTEPFALLGKKTLISYKPDEISEYIHSAGSLIISVLMSGDCGFYSGAERLLPLISEYDVRIISGISTPVYFCNKLGITWQDMAFVSLHGVDNSIVRSVCANRKTFFLLGGEITPSEICRRLCEYGLSSVSVYIGERLSLDGERITSGKASLFTDMKFDKLCVILCKNENHEKYVMSGISDGEFIRGNVPMTKSEVRCVAVSRLCVGKDDICWDIGSGTGSVAVELAIKCKKVYAVEKKAEAVRLTDENRHKFGCDNIDIIASDAADCLDALPAPDCVFIGGSGGEMQRIISAACAKNPFARIVVTAVSLETLNEATDVFERLGLDCEITQLAVTRTRKLGGRTMLAAENPIFVIGRA